MSYQSFQELFLFQMNYGLWQGVQVLQMFQKVVDAF